jgi:ATP/maltotriose-dependent transcriptional regulator MalT
VTDFCAGVAKLRGDLASSEPLYVEAVRLAREAGETRVEVHALSNLAIVVAARGDYGSGIALHQNAVSIARANDDDWALMAALNNFGGTLLDTADVDGARSSLGEALEVSRRLGELAGAAITAGNLAELMLGSGDLDAAGPLIEEALAHARAIQYSPVISWMQCLDAVLLVQRGEHVSAENRLDLALEAVMLEDDSQTRRTAVAAAAALATAREDWLVAATLWAALDREISGHTVPDVWLVTQLSREWLPQAFQGGSVHGWEAAWARGTSLPLSEALQLARRH